MKYIVDEENKVIFGWSAKCGCSHLKTIFWFLKTNEMKEDIHDTTFYLKLPSDIENYTTIIVCRNPYKRIVSCFLDKFKRGGELRRRDVKTLSFFEFVNAFLIKDKTFRLNIMHHISPQTSEKFDNKILLSKELKIYDLSNIDYNYIEKLYSKTIPKCVLERTFGHERKVVVKNESVADKYVYDLDIDEYVQSNVETKYFYNDDIKNIIFNYYENDFNFFKLHGLNYSL